MVLYLVFAWSKVENFTQNCKDWEKYSAFAWVWAHVVFCTKKWGETVHGHIMKSGMMMCTAQKGQLVMLVLYTPLLRFSFWIIYNVKKIKANCRCLYARVSPPYVWRKGWREKKVTELLGWGRAGQVLWQSWVYPRSCGWSPVLSRSHGST